MQKPHTEIPPPMLDISRQSSHKYIMGEAPPPPQVLLIRESSKVYISSKSTCAICHETKPLKCNFSMKCTHVFCLDCIKPIMTIAAASEWPRCPLESNMFSITDLHAILDEQHFYDLLIRHIDLFRSKFQKEFGVNPSSIEEFTSTISDFLPSSISDKTKAFVGQFNDHLTKSISECKDDNDISHKFLLIDRLLHTLDWVDQHPPPAVKSYVPPPKTETQSCDYDYFDDVFYNDDANAGPVQGIGYGGNCGPMPKAAMDCIEERKAIEIIQQKRFTVILSVLNSLFQSHILSVELFSALYCSNLNAFLVKQLRNQSLLEYSTNPPFYKAIIDVVNLFASNPVSLVLLRPNKTNMAESIGKHVSIVQILINMKPQTMQFLKEIDRDNSDAEEIILIDLIESFRDLITLVTANSENYLKMLPVDVDKQKEEKEEKSTECDEMMNIQIEEFLQSLTFQAIDVSASPLRHYYAADSEKNATKNSGNRKRMTRIRKELVSLSSNLPIGIYVRVDETVPDLIRVFVIGPEDTPYQNGMFGFDFYLPSNYPDSPPQVNFRTTGRGTFRFNPNLYKNGKVCLSLLGTWQGPGWEPKVSTLLQVFISIWAFVFCDCPYANEPGWENQSDLPISKNYNGAIRHATMLFAMLDYLKDPPFGFEDVVSAHFYRSRQKILKQIDDAIEWETEKLKSDDKDKKKRRQLPYGNDCIITAKSLNDTAAELRELLSKLPAPKLEDQ